MTSPEADSGALIPDDFPDDCEPHLYTEEQLAGLVESVKDVDPDEWYQSWRPPPNEQFRAGR